MYIISFMRFSNTRKHLSCDQILKKIGQKLVNCGHNSEDAKSKQFGIEEIAAGHREHADKEKNVVDIHKTDLHLKKTESEKLLRKQAEGADFES